ncbi:MAG: TonB-dependent receptor [Calditrichaeota bacterium]|nr:TonB-dependent receptor [Calditrichota bacterium]
MTAACFILGKRPRRLLYTLLFLLLSPVLLVSLEFQSGQIAGVVRMEKTRDPISGVKVAITGTGSVAATDHRGRFVIEDVAPGTHQIRISAVGYETVLLPDIVVKSGATTIVDVLLRLEDVTFDDILVFGASRRLERMAEAPAAVTRVSDLQLKQFSATGQIPGLFADQPGLDVVQNGVNDFNINARGFNTSLNRRVKVLLDGRETAMAFLLAQEWNTFAKPLADLGDLEFVRGPGSPIYGANAFSGVLNIKTPDPEKIVGTKISLAAGELNTVRGDFRHAGIYEHWGYKFNVGAVRSNTWDESRNLPQEELDRNEYGGLTPEFAPLDDDDLSSIYASGRLDYNFETGDVVTFEAGISEALDQVFVTGIGRVQVDDVIRPWARMNFNSERYYFQADYNARKTLNGQQRALSSLILFKENSYDVNLQLQRHFSRSADRLRFVLGASQRFQHVDTDQILTPDRYNENQSGLFTQLDFRFSPGWKFVAAGRIDRSTLHSTQVSPKAALVYSPSPAHAFRFTYNSAFQTPNYAEFFLRTSTGAPQDLAVLEAEIELAIELEYGLPRNSVDLPLDLGFTPRLALGNDDLDVEKVNSLELGYTGLMAGKLSVAADVYYSHVTDFVTHLLPGVNPVFLPYQVPDGVPEEWREITERMIHDSVGPGLTTLPDGSEAVVISYTNVGVDEWGLEIGLKYALTDHFFLRGAYAYFDYDVEEKARGDLLLPNTPKHKFNLGLTYEGGQGIDFGAFLRYVDDVDWAAGIFHGPVPAYTVVNVAGGYSFDSSTRIGITVTNLFDNEHYELFGGSVNGRRALGSVSFEF